MESPSKMEQVFAEDDPQPPEEMEDHQVDQCGEESAPETATENLPQSASDATQPQDLEEPASIPSGQCEVTPSYGPQCPEELIQSKVVEIAQTSVQYEPSCTEQYLKGCKWAPDGTCIVTNNSDNALRIYNLPSFLYEASQELPPEPQDIPQAVLIKEGGLILDYCWYPQMSSMDAATCCLLSCSTKCPVHLWDAFDGSLRASYNPINRVDEVEGATSLVFTPDGQKFYCGSKNFVRVFDVCRPGRQSESRELKHHQQPAEYRQPGIVSAIAVNKANDKLYAVGSYRKSVGLYAEPDGRLVCLLHGHKGGVTQLTFSNDGLKLFSGAR
jgi:telomerase Cajal body protein 1